MELRHLRYFVVVAEEENVTRAAVRLHLSQPPLSRQIRDLEEDLQVRLFERGGKSVRLTEAGRFFLDEARAVLARADEARRAVRACASGRSVELHLGYAPSLTVELLPATLRAFADLEPGVQVVLHDMSTEQMLGGLRDGSLEAAMMIRPEAGARTGLVYHELRRYGLRVAVPPGHPLGHGPRPPLARVFAHRLMAYTRADYPEYHAWLAALARQAGAASARIAEEHDSSTSLVAAVEAGRGVALVPESFSCFAGQRLQLVVPKPAPGGFSVGLVTRARPSDSVQGFLRSATEAADAGSARRRGAKESGVRRLKTG